MNWKLEGEYINVSKFTSETSPSELNFETHDITGENSGKIRLTHQERYGSDKMYGNIHSNSATKSSVNPMSILKMGRLFNVKR